MKLNKRVGKWNENSECVFLFQQLHMMVCHSKLRKYMHIDMHTSQHIQFFLLISNSLKDFEWIFHIFLYFLMEKSDTISCIHSYIHCIQYIENYIIQYF